eukprot:2141389-Pyramimonas_sp.AAC.1
MRPPCTVPAVGARSGLAGDGGGGEMVRPSGTWSRCPLVFIVCSRFPAPCNGAQCSTFPRGPVGKAMWSTLLVCPQCP